MEWLGATSGHSLPLAYRRLYDPDRTYAFDKTSGTGDKVSRFAVKASGRKSRWYLLERDIEAAGDEYSIARVGVLRGLKGTHTTPIFVRDRPVWTSAGMTAGIDLALAMVEKDLDHEVALGVARSLVVCLKLPGGQAQSVRRSRPGR